MADTDKGILRSIDAFSHDELSKALYELSNLRCADEVGIVAEMLKYSSSKFRTELLRIFNDSLHSGEFDESWHRTVFQMIPKDGDLSNVSNWRPIAILSIMYKIFLVWFTTGYRRSSFACNHGISMLSPLKSGLKTL